jgi:radical SAM superfamily enzyme YgiQ (UPF0313 family)
MHYDGTIIRPPNEAESIILQVTLGCSHNKCAFCGAYKDKKFAIKDEKTVLEDIAFAAKNMKDFRRVFLADGDALIIPQEKLVKILREIRRQLPWVSRVGTYGNAKSIARKTLDELKELKGLGLGIVYMGLESGDDETLIKMHKHDTASVMIAQGKKIQEAGMKLSVIVLLGLAGHPRSEIHARETGKALSAIDPQHVGALSLMLIPGTPLYADWKNGRFTPLAPLELLQELRTMIEHTNLSQGLFYANHASNYLPLQVRLPRDKNKALALIDPALRGETALRPEWSRGL